MPSCRLPEARHRDADSEEGRYPDAERAELGGRVGRTPGAHPVGLQPKHRAVALEVHRAVLRVLRAQQLERAREVGAGAEHRGAALDAHPRQARPVLVPDVDEQGGVRVLTDVAQSPQLARALGLVVHGREERCAVEGEAYGNEQGTAAGVGGRQPADAGLAEHREGPRRRLVHGDGYRISFAYWSSSGSTLSRGSGGSRKIERVTPAAAKSSRTFLSGGVAKAETEIVRMSRPAFAARALRSFMPSTTFSGARPRGYQPSQKSTTRCRV